MPHDAQRRRPIGRVIISVSSMRKTDAAPAPHTAYGYTEDPIVLSWAIGLLISHMILQQIIGSAKPGVVAHQACTLVAFGYAAYNGVLLWLYDDIVMQQHEGNFVDRLYGTNERTSEICRFMFGFQLYDLASTALVPELRKLEIVGHHAATLLTAMASNSHGGPFFNYYIPFFFGFTELSSLPLVFVDLFRQLPKLGTQYSAINELSRTLFAVSFLIIRVCYFPYVMLTKWWPDMWQAWSGDDVRCTMTAFGWMGFSSVFLTLLQLFWGYKIIRVIAKGNLGGKDANASQAEAD